MNKQKQRYQKKFAKKTENISCFFNLSSFAIW